jgi:hypothetical protein
MPRGTGAAPAPRACPRLARGGSSRRGRGGRPAAPGRGQSRRVTSTVPSLALRKRGSNPADAIASWSTARLCRAAARVPGFGTPRAARYRPHSRARSVARVRARAPEARPARISARRRKSRFSRSIRSTATYIVCGRPDRRALAGLAPDQPGLLEPAQVRAERVRVQGQARRELADRDRTAREPEVPVQPEPRVVGERLVDLERGRLTAGHGRLLAIGGTGARRRPRASDVPWEKARFAPCQSG